MPLFAGQPHMLDKMREAVQAHQKGAAAQDYAVALAQVLERLLQGQSVNSAIAAAAEIAPPGASSSFAKAIQHAHAQRNDVLKVCRAVLLVL